MTRIKICGIREETHALAAAEAGADFIGLVFAPSQRQVTPAQGKKIASAVKQSGKATRVAGVFVNMPASKVNKIAELCNLDWVQLSGDESWEYCTKVDRPVIKSVRIGQQHPMELYAHLAIGERVLVNQQRVYLLDSQVKGSYGGTGIAFDWRLARHAAERFPVVIAGGLTPENVAQAIKTVAPWGVDVSSGVETDGIKDMVKIRAFIEAVRRTEGEYT